MTDYIQDFIAAVLLADEVVRHGSGEVGPERHRLVASTRAGVVQEEVVLDDRDERAGVKFKDADLIGFPIRVTAGKKATEGLLEVKMRDADKPVDLPKEEILAFVQQQVREWQPSLKQPALQA